MATFISPAGEIRKISPQNGITYRTDEQSCAKHQWYRILTVALETSVSRAFFLKERNQYATHFPLSIMSQAKQSADRGSAPFP